MRQAHSWFHLGSSSYATIADWPTKLSLSQRDANSCEDGLGNRGFKDRMAKQRGSVQARSRMRVVDVLLPSLPPHSCNKSDLSPPRNRQGRSLWPGSGSLCSWGRTVAVPLTPPPADLAGHTLPHGSRRNTRRRANVIGALVPVVSSACSTIGASKALSLAASTMSTAVTNMPDAPSSVFMAETIA